MNFVDINKNRIRYTLIEGDPCMPYLVFLHEGLGCIEMWKEFPVRLCRLCGCPGLLYDRQGYGQSSPFTLKRDIEYVHAYAQELGLLLDILIGNRPFILVGHSDGASIALIYGAGEHHRLKAIVSEAAHVFVEAKTTAGVEAAYRHYRENGAPKLIKYHGDKTDALFRAWGEIWLSDWFQSWNIEKLLPEITCPVLVLQGTADAYGTMKQVEAIASQVSGPAEPIMIKGCGHTPHRECGDLVLAYVQDFIDRHVSPPHHALTPNPQPS